MHFISFDPLGPTTAFFFSFLYAKKFISIPTHVSLAKYIHVIQHYYGIQLHLLHLGGVNFLKGKLQCNTIDILITLSHYSEEKSISHTHFFLNFLKSLKRTIKCSLMAKSEPQEMKLGVSIHQKSRRLLKLL